LAQALAADADTQGSGSLNLVCLGLEVNITLGDIHEDVALA